MALSLNVPIIAGSLGKDIETNLKKAKQWVESLPLTRLHETAQQLVQHICALNRAKISCDDRVALLDIYQPTIAVLLDELEAIYAASLLPFPAKQLEARNLAVDLIKECSYTYKLYLMEKSGKLIMFNAKKQLPGPLYQAMHYLFALMRLSYQTYHPVPAGIWQELHLLHQYADEQGIRNEMPETDSKTSIGDIYLDALLLSLADPYRLMSSEVEATLEILRQHRGLLALRTDSDVPQPTRLFIMALDTDLPPRPLIHFSSPPLGQFIRLLYTHRLVERLTQRAQSSPSTGSKQPAPQAHGDLIARLLRQWGDPPKRQFRRNDTEAGALICCGIKALCHFTALAAQADNGSEIQLIEDGNTIPLLAIPQDPTSQALGIETWQVLNQSSNGLRMQRDQAGRVGITVGELIGVRFVGGQWWNIGVVRWLTVLADSSIEFGVQLISPSATSATIEATIGNNTRIQPALLLAPSYPEMPSDEVITVSETYADLREFELISATESCHIRATFLLEKTPRFELFQFNPS